MKGKKCVGEEGERIAALYLEGLGQRIIYRNWRAAHKEIDIISLQDKVLHIVEVKSVTAHLEDPVLKVDGRKQKNLTEAAKAFLNSEHRENLPHDLEVNFDVVSIVFDENDSATVRYYPQAYIPIYV